MPRSTIEQPILKPWELLQKAIPGTQITTFRVSSSCRMREEIAKSTGKPKRIIEGVASTPYRDLQNETVIQEGLDLRYFLAHGYYNLNHKDGMENKVGQPTDAVIKKVVDAANEPVAGLFTRGFLWDAGTHPVADSVWQLAKALESSDADRKLGFSIQGKVLERDGTTILKAWVQEIAITEAPINSRTWLRLVHDLNKSLIPRQQLHDLCKSINATSSIMDAPDIGDALETLERNDKAMTAAGAGRILAPESLAGTREATFQKSYLWPDLARAYRYLRDRGHAPSVASKAAIVAVSRSLLG